MGQVSAASTVLIDAEPAAVFAAVADYQTVRPKILSRTTAATRFSRAGRVRAPWPHGSCRPRSHGCAT